jgi:hypothetical protein
MFYYFLEFFEIAVNVEATLNLLLLPSSCLRSINTATAYEELGEMEKGKMFRQNLNFVLMFLKLIIIKFKYSSIKEIKCDLNHITNISSSYDHQ